MRSRFKSALTQLHYLLYEVRQPIGSKPWRWLTCWFGGSVGVIISYRVDRFFYLLVGRPWALLRILLFPLFSVLRLLSANHQIHYRADIGKGLRILHPALGVVVSGHARIGKSLILTGGNCIGGRRALKPGELVLGDNITLGANAIVLGPVRIGSRTTIGAGAVVVKDSEDDVVLAGVPAHVIGRSIELNPIYKS